MYGNILIGIYTDNKEVSGHPSKKGGQMFRRSTMFILCICLFALSASTCGGPSGGTGNSSSTPAATSSPSANASVSLALSPTPTFTAPLQVTGITISINPVSLATIPCGMAMNIVFSAQINVAPESVGGQVPYSWNINHAPITGNATFTPGQRSQTVQYTLNNFVIQINSASAVSGSISVGISGKTLVSTTVAPTGVCKLPGPFQVVNITISTNPASVTGVICGTTINVTYIATVTIAPNSNAGTVSLVWNEGFSTPGASINFAPAQTVGTTTLVISERAAHRTDFPRPVSIASTSPSAINTGPVAPSGRCS